MDLHTDHKCCKDPHEEKDAHPSPTIILEEDSDDEEAPDEESRASPILIFTNLKCHILSY